MSGATDPPSQRGAGHLLERRRRPEVGPLPGHARPPARRGRSHRDGGGTREGRRVRARRRLRLRLDHARDRPPRRRRPAAHRRRHLAPDARAGPRRAREAGLANATFLQADAQTYEFRPEFDVLFSRFGVMFFDDPSARSPTCTAPCAAARAWPSRAGSPCIATRGCCPMMAALQHITIDTPPTPDAPGPFAFADAARVEGILAPPASGAW